MKVRAEQSQLPRTDNTQGARVELGEKENAGSQRSVFMSFVASDREVLKELLENMRNTMYMALVLTAVNTLLLFERIDDQSTLTKSRELLYIFFSLANAMLISFAMQSFKRAISKDAGRCGLPLLLQGVQRLSVLFSHMSTVVFAIGIVQAMQAAIADPELVVLLQVFIILAIVLRLGLLTYVVGGLGSFRPDPTAVRAADDDAPLQLHRPAEARRSFDEDMDQALDAPAWLVSLIGCYSLVYVSRPYNECAADNALQAEYELSGPEEQVLRAGMDEIIWARASVTLLVLSTVLLATTDYQEGNSAEGFASSVDALEQLGLDLALSGAVGSFSEVLFTRGKDMTHLMEGMSSHKGLGRFFETWTAVQLAAVVGSLVQLHIVNEWLTVPTAKIMAKLI